MGQRMGKMPSKRKFKDQFDHERNLAYQRHKSQCAFRDEPFKITLKQWFEIWSDPEQWARRGRAGDALCLTRLDITKPWTTKNVEIMTRADQVRRSKYMYMDEWGCAPNYGKKHGPRKSKDV